MVAADHPVLPAAGQLHYGTGCSQAAAAMVAAAWPALRNSNNDKQPPHVIHNHVLTYSLLMKLVRPSYAVTAAYCTNRQCILFRACHLHATIAQQLQVAATSRACV
jgi:hypothetical protein